MPRRQMSFKNSHIGQTITLVVVQGAASVHHIPTLP